MGWLPIEELKNISLAAFSSFIEAQEKKEQTVAENKIAAVQRGRKARKEAQENNISIHIGTYGWVHGPTYETPAEIKRIKNQGGDVVGMSTMPEIDKALKYGLDVIGVSCLSNYAAGIKNVSLKHIDVIKMVEKSKNNFIKLLNQIIKIYN